jgi:hypothetical protein
MSLFFDAAWFDARLTARRAERGDLAAAAGLDRAELHRVFTNERAATAQELQAFAAFLDADLVEVALRSGVTQRGAEVAVDSQARISSIEARLDQIDDWIAELESQTKRRA